LAHVVADSLPGIEGFNERCDLLLLLLPGLLEAVAAI
jgi:hypothetical protein